MSSIIALSASLKMAGVLLNGKTIEKVVTEDFDTFRVPSDIEYEIQNSANPKEKYIDSIKNMWWADIIDDHIEEFNKWLVDHDGWKINWYVEI